MNLFLEFAARGRTAWWRYPLALLLGLLITIVAGVGLSFGLQASGLLAPGFQNALLTPGEPIGFFVANGVLFGLVLAGFAAAFRIVHGKRFTDIVGRWSWRAYAIGIGVWSIALALATLVDVAIDPSGFRFSGGGATLTLFAVALPALAVQTFAEEFVFRGYVTQGLLLATRRPLLTALLSGLIFGSMHIPNGAPQAVSAAVFGVVLAMIAIRQGGIAFTSGLHLVNNLCGAVVVVSSNDAFRGAPGIFTQNTPQLMWLDVFLGAAALLIVAIFVVNPPRRNSTASLQG